MANKEVREIIAVLVKQRWRIEDQGPHYKCFPPDLSKPMVVIAKTPGGGRWKQNTLAQLRKSGANI